MTTSPLLKRPVSYYGGKHSIIKHILKLIPYHEVYTEVFFGGGTVFFAKDPVRTETINDRLNMVVNFYEVLQSDFTALKQLIDRTLVSRYQHRKAYKILTHSSYFTKVEYAWAFWMCSNFSHSNKIGGGLKYSNQDNMRTPTLLKNLKEKFTEELVKRIEGVHIECNDALQVLHSRNVENAFHYIDPPYPNTDQGYYRGYGFGEYEALLEYLKKIKGKFLLSSYNSPILDTYITRNNWNKKEIIHRLKAPRKSGDVKCEVLVWNYPETKINGYAKD